MQFFSIGTHTHAQLWRRGLHCCYEAQAASAKPMRGLRVFVPQSKTV